MFVAAKDPSANEPESPRAFMAFMASTPFSSSASSTLDLSLLPPGVASLVAQFGWSVRSASAAGLLPVLLLLLRFDSEKRSSSRSPKAMDAAAKGGHLTIVRALHARGFPSSVFAMNMAAANGHLATLKFLHQRRPEGCTAYAMNAAAANGHLATLKFLHFHRPEGCTTAAMDLAAAHGWTRVVEFLHRHRCEGCTVAAVDRAAQNGHLDVVRFLVERRSAEFTGLAVVWALQNGHVEVGAYLSRAMDSRRHSSAARSGFAGINVVPAATLAV